MGKLNYRTYIDDNTIRLEASGRGGGIEINLSDLLKINRDTDDNDYLMSAYQNYLGGGMLGRICNSYNFEIDKLSKARQVKVAKMAEVLKRYFHDLTNHEGDEWEEQTYSQNQNMPVSAY